MRQNVFFFKHKGIFDDQMMIGFQRKTDVMLSYILLWIKYSVQIQNN